MNRQHSPSGAVGRALTALSRAAAVCGGAVLTALTVMSVVSIASRALFGVAVPGDFEMVEMGCGIAVFAFLPYGHLVRGNVIVDFVTLKAGPKLKGALDSLGGAIYLAIAVLLLWRMILGAADKLSSHETTMILAVPIWIAFVPIVTVLLLLIAVVAYVAVQDARLALGRMAPPS